MLIHPTATAGDPCVITRRAARVIDPTGCNATVELLVAVVAYLADHPAEAVGEGTRERALRARWGDQLPPGIADLVVHEPVERLVVVAYMTDRGLACPRCARRQPAERIGEAVYARERTGDCAYCSTSIRPLAVVSR